jgi:hypothetical protein
MALLGTSGLQLVDLRRWSLKIVQVVLPLSVNNFVPSFIFRSACPDLVWVPEIEVTNMGTGI